MGLKGGRGGGRRFVRGLLRGGVGFMRKMGGGEKVCVMGNWEGNRRKVGHATLQAVE